MRDIGMVLSGATQLTSRPCQVTQIREKHTTRSRNREAARFFNVDESNIRLWRRNKTNFENCDRRKRADRRGKPHWPELEAEINKWILKERDDGKAVSTVSIRMKDRVLLPAKWSFNGRTEIT
ncbi:uncharacterized protein TNCV_4073521 [Trichonephila clavipes]|uniref:Transposase n=1 Tax=Trichonephila clavipes TaxID=2585209 RepID=A0A8X6W8C0_TRICX|nr:uncharacterized protein TNCV_4073521 [Trichonephila clavipes]